MQVRTGISTGDLLREINHKDLTLRGLQAIISSLRKSQNFWRVVEMSKQPLPLVANVIDSLIDKGYLRVNGEEILFTDKLSDLDENEIGEFGDLKCKGCNGRGIEIDEFSDILKEFNKIAKYRPEALREFDQGFVSEENTIARMALMHRKGDLKGRDILLIGDDDLLSIAIWLTGLASRLTVLEIDTRLTSFIEEVTKGEVEVVEYDVSNRLPEAFLGRYDVFFTDPTESLHGFKVFLKRGMLSLNSSGAGYFGLTRIEASLKKWFKIQKFINESGFVITDMIDEFNHYQDWEYYMHTKAYKIAPVKSRPAPYWYKSTQIRIEKTFDITIENDEVSDLQYLDEESSTV